MARYLLDANVLIQAHRLHYKHIFCPAFWDWIEIRSTYGYVKSVDAIREEILRPRKKKRRQDQEDNQQQNDWLSEWARKLGSDFFLKPDMAAVEAHVEVADWVAARDFAPASMHNFFRADSYLIAHTLAHNDIVVTHEKLVGSDSKQVKIPNVCDGLGVCHTDPFSMLSLSGVQFVLPPFFDDDPPNDELDDG